MEWCILHDLYISVAKDSINFQLHTISAQNYTTPAPQMDHPV